MTKPKNKYKHGSITWSVMEGDWEDLTVSEIAEVLGTSEDYIRTAMKRIKKETGYEVQHRRSKSGKKPEKLEEPEKSEETNDVENFPDRLRRMRKRKRLSRLALGELCGLSKNVIALYEGGLRKPSMDSAIALADYFDVSIDYLIARTDNPQRLL